MKKIFFIVIFICSFLLACNIKPNETTLPSTNNSETISNDVIRINDKINSLELIENDEERMLTIMEIEREIKMLSASNQNNINNEKLLSETSRTTIILKNNLNWEDHLNMNVNYIDLNEIIDGNKILGINIYNNRRRTEMWVSQNKTFYNKILQLLDLPYIDIIGNYGAYEEFDIPTDINYRDYKSLVLQMGDNKSIEIGIPENGYVRIYVRGLNEYNQHSLYYSFVSLIKGDFDAISEVLSSENLVKQDAELSLVSYIIQSYSVATSSTTGPEMTFNLDGATFECSIDCGSFSYYDKIQKYNASSGEIVIWSVSYFENYRTSDQIKVHIMPEIDDMSYMDVIIRMNNDIIGYIIIEMKHVGNTINYETNTIDSYLFKDENNNYTSVSYEYIIGVINESKERVKNEK